MRSLWVLISELATKRHRRLTALMTLWLCCVLLIPAPAIAKSQVLIIIDDVGYRPSDTQTLTLPTPVTLSILPDTPLASAVAAQAARQGRDVMLHLPMEADSGYKLGPLALTADMYPHTIADTLRQALRSVPNARGINNHMGSRLTRERLPMQALMQAVKKEGLFFIDSRTTPDSVAATIAENTGIPTAIRDVFLDHEHSEAFLQQQMALLVRIAKKHGLGIGIAHPHPLSVDFLRRTLPQLKHQGVELISVSDLFAPATPSRWEPEPKRRLTLAPQ
ncbi:divergent polysaccharide deacetylase family protein [Alteromonas sp. ASW11-19]|uniref:Divergent polysaccharide deacetylase family protein n=1 Tax=Alteromonas salexigens TaxID=2982530 RepID=A0ABT2VKE6_9ALTE|nr:divergent polysaccharide deacetylase family protein [Alteromonas salexigens]MCU7553283.1 divergent polysaccharide deacetylase family protein [Alteromonas salexigens]